jgi:hypothetical protein
MPSASTKDVNTWQSNRYLLRRLCGTPLSESVAVIPIFLGIGASSTDTGLPREVYLRYDAPLHACRFAVRVA